MVIKMLKTYTISIIIQEGEDEFWEGLRGKSGCDEVVEDVREALAAAGYTDCHVRLHKYEERGAM